jgi:arsenate reductase
MPSKEAYSVLFLCTGNSCRSQMAEALINARLGDTWTAYSAGTEPAEQVNPLALEALDEIGIQHQGEAKSVNVYHDHPFDLVVTVCDDAAENCPVWLGRGQKVHLGFADPAKATGSHDEVMPVFRQTLADIAAHIPPLLEQQLAKIKSGS